MTNKRPNDLSETSKRRLANILSPAGYTVAFADPRLHDRIAHLQPDLMDRPIRYVLGANGLYKTAYNHRLAAFIPVTTWPRALPGLEFLRGWLSISTGPDGFFTKVPRVLLDACLEHARRESWARPRETMYQFYFRGRRIHVAKPDQIGTAGSVIYNTNAVDQADVILDLHTHPGFSAEFSARDNRDEGGLRLYAVLGRIYDRAPELAVRVGVYGDFMRVPARLVFDGFDAAGRDQAYTDTYRE